MSFALVRMRVRRLWSDLAQASGFDPRAGGG
ncbi:hypothetical protein SAMN04489717_3683 [Actinopolymorpha singaporensis]|uniref:Uncharacterized protein n=1 Tax=Actinopolymorpha singaporensis TaxID=117157 RepID=A0A1H1UM67_9ACTN|nr:hypothetical protein SAMN04489717_3683 [Actinopolymorpha singaporensis]